MVRAAKRRANGELPDHGQLAVMRGINMTLETALLKIIDSKEGKASTAQIYSALERGEYFTLQDHHLKATIYGDRPAYQHEVRSYLSNLVQSGHLTRVSRGMYSITQIGKSRLTEIDKITYDPPSGLLQEYLEEEDRGYDDEFPEGREIEKKHKLRERNQAVIRTSKELFRKTYGKLFCQVCGFDFYTQYGDIGFDFIEGHHTLPISELKGEVKTKVEDIALVCSNCHRMLHRKGPWLEMAALKNLINSNA